MPGGAKQSESKALGTITTDLGLPIATGRSAERALDNICLSNRIPLTLAISPPAMGPLHVVKIRNLMSSF